jgi:hypothetical protein
MGREIELIKPNSFEQENHFYPKALNAQLHPMVSHFLNLNHDQIIERYIHLNPKVDRDSLKELLQYKSKHFFWGGSDLFYVTTEKGNRQMVILETNSCPSGQKSMPPRSDADEYRGYRLLLENAFIPRMKKKRSIKGALAVVYDKNYMENTGYASTLADLTNEDVYLVPHFDNEDNKNCYFKDGILYVKDPAKGDIPIRAAFRYVTQKPWNRIPVESKTFIFNSSLVCLAGGRNKLLANKAYEFFNAEIAESGLKITMPETIKDVSKVEIPLWVKKFGGRAVVKNPYSNAGQGVYTITSESELDAFMQEEHDYDQFIVQSLIGHYEWSSISEAGRFYHIGTVPNKKGGIFVADLRMMIYSSEEGIYPAAIYARKAKKSLKAEISEDDSSWEMLGTNLSIKLEDNKWDSDTNRLMMMDRKDFNSLGIGIDDLIEAYIQTVLSVIAIDKMSQNLLNKKGGFRKRLFKSLDNDENLIKEIMIGS